EPPGAHPRPAARDLWPAGEPAPPRAGRRARPHRPLAVDQRPQPRRLVPRPAPPLARRRRGLRPLRQQRELGGRPRGAGRRGRGRDPPRRAVPPEVRAHQGDPRGDRGSALARPPRADDRARRAGRARRAARRGPQDRGVRAAVQLRRARHPRRHARLAGRRPARDPPADEELRRAARRDAADHPARRGARAAREPPPPRPPDLSRAAPVLHEMRAEAHVPEPPRM
ncbi:MAG: Endonuclease III, partial [uncultured Solirubrobacteraceae bacterium]